MRLSAILVSRNDDYGGHLKTRATFCLNTMLDAFDEVVYVDWNSPNGRPLTDELDIIVHPEKLKVVIVTPEDAKRMMGEENYKNGQKCCEVLGRNVGIRRATGDYIIDTNIDIICPRRTYIEEMIHQMKPNEMFTIARYGVEREMVQNIWQATGKSFQETRDMVTMIRGVDSINASIMFNTASVNKEILESVPPQVRFNAASVITNCGDFQVAHRDTWWAIRGFEESQIKRTFIDTQLQYKVIMNGGVVRAFNLPPVYHIDHERDSSHAMNERVFVEYTKNTENWGFPGEPLEVRWRPKVIISLTTIPSRLGELNPVLIELSKQTCHEIWLNIPKKYNRFPEWDGTIPDVLETIPKVRVNRDCEDVGPGTKIFGVLNKGLDSRDLIIYLDDDTLYDEKMVTNLLKWHRTDPTCAWGLSGFKFENYFSKNYPREHGTLHDVLEGYGGVIMKLKWIRDIHDEFKELASEAKFADDVVISNLLEKIGVGRKTVCTPECNIGQIKQMSYGFGSDALHHQISGGHHENYRRVLTCLKDKAKNYFKYNVV